MERAGLEQDACEIVLVGADSGTPKEEPVPPGPVSCARSLPRNKALQREVLIAYQMNGRDLPLHHGYPVRAIVPGHYGIYETLAANQRYPVFGMAWAGETEPTEISVSSDGGQTWAKAEFLDPVQRYAWRRWRSGSPFGPERRLSRSGWP